MVDAVVRRHRDDRLADEDQIQAARERHRVALEVVEELAASLVGVDAPDVNRKRPVDLVTPAETRGVGSRRHFRSHADDDAGDVLVARRILDHRPLFVRVVHDPADASEHRPEYRQADGCIPFGRRYEDGFGRQPSRAVPGVIVAIAEEQDVVEGVGRAREVVDEGGAGRPFAVQPGQLVGEGMGLLEYPARAAAELERMTFAGHGEAADRNTVDGLGPRRELVTPADVVARAGRDDLYLCVLRQAFRDVACVQLRSAVDVGAVSLDDYRELHDSAGPLPVSPEGPDDSPPSARPDSCPAAPDGPVLSPPGP